MSKVGRASILPKCTPKHETFTSSYPQWHALVISQILEHDFLRYVLGATELRGRLPTIEAITGIPLNGRDSHDHLIRP